MPFIPKEGRERLKKPGEEPQNVGEMCYLEYVKIMDQWKQRPRWQTVHKLAQDALSLSDQQAAEILAFLVFFSKHAMKYEDQKSQENGDI